MNRPDLSRDMYMLEGKLARHGYDWWWHSFTGISTETGREKTFFIEYFIINPDLGGLEVIYGQTKENRQNGIKPSYVMVKAGCWGEGKKQINSFYPISALRMSKNRLNLKVGKCFLSEKYMTGEVSVSEEEAIMHPEYMSDSGKMKWKIKIDKKIAFNVGYGASLPFRKMNAFEMFWHAQGMKTQYSGTVVIDGELYEIKKDKSYGYADKNWGSDFTSPWVWLSSCNLYSERYDKKLDNSALDVGGGRPRAFGISFNDRLLIDLYYEGKDYEFNFSKFYTFVKTRYKCYETDDSVVWKIVSKTPLRKIVINASCKKSDMLKINYESPDGEKRHNRLWNGGTGIGTIELYETIRGRYVLIDRIHMENAGCEYGIYS